MSFVVLSLLPEQVDKVVYQGLCEYIVLHLKGCEGHPDVNLINSLLNVLSYITPVGKETEELFQQIRDNTMAEMERVIAKGKSKLQ